MTKKLLFLTVIILMSLSSLKGQTLSNLMFESTISPTTTNVSITFDFDGVADGDVFEWQLFIANASGEPDWGVGRNVAYKTAIVPNTVGSGTQTVELGIYNTPVVGEVFTWTGVIKVGGITDAGWNNAGNLVTISETAGVENTFSKQISLYPNPSSDMLKISNKKFDIKSIQIFALNGEKVIDYKSNNKELISVNVSNLTNGIYLVSAGGKKTAKFLKN
jgi:hypothetical protein